jgi:uncharacterized protein (DUF4415 family)
MKNTKLKPELIDAVNPEITTETLSRSVSFSEFAKDHNISIPKEDNILVNGKPRVYRGKQKSPVKVAISIRLKPDTLSAFRETGEGWQTRIDDALAEYVRSGKLTN